MPVRVVVEGGPYAGVSRTEVARRARAMLSAVSWPDAELSIVLTGDDRMRELNARYRKKARTTDVLAFAQHEGAFGDRADALLGDVIVSVPQAGRQAIARRRSIGNEVTMLLAHGLLHLLGWDHDTPARDRRMRAETDRLCAAAAAAQRRRRRPRVGRSARKASRTAR